MGDFLTWVCLQKGIFCILQKAIFPSHSLSLARLYVHSCRRFVGGVVVDSSRSIVCSLLQKYLFKQKCFHIIYHGQMRTEQIYLLHHGTIYDSRLWRGPLCVAMFITRKGCMYVLCVMHFVNQCFEKRFQRVLQYSKGVEYLFTSTLVMPHEQKKENYGYMWSWKSVRPIRSVRV